ncbi:MAG: hypothetical protein R6W82_08960 [bacterium]
MSRGAKIIRGANFAHPWSERDQYYSPATVRILLGVSVIVVLLLVALPFYLDHMREVELDRRSDLVAESTVMSRQAEALAPVLRMRAVLDSVRTELQARVNMLEAVRKVDYPFDRLLVHIGELIPDGLVLTGLEVRPPARSQAGRPGLTGGDTALPSELQDAYVLTLRGTAQRAEILTRFTEVMTRSPLFFEPRSQPNVHPEGGLSFTISARLPGSGGRLEGEGG